MWLPQLTDIRACTEKENENESTHTIAAMAAPGRNRAGPCTTKRCAEKKNIKPRHVQQKRRAHTASALCAKRVCKYATAGGEPARLCNYDKHVRWHGYIPVLQNGTAIYWALLRNGTGMDTRGRTGASFLRYSTRTLRVCMCYEHKLLSMRSGERGNYAHMCPCACHSLHRAAPAPAPATPTVPGPTLHTQVT